MSATALSLSGGRVTSTERRRYGTHRPKETGADGRFRTTAIVFSQLQEQLASSTDELRKRIEAKIIGGKKEP